jgi:archaellum component FlaF (FlaF/FlaG flagellin family)
MALQEKTHISQFNVQPNGCINVRKTTDVLKDGVVIAQNHWRCVLAPSDTVDTLVLNETYYATLAQQAWTAEVIAAYKATEATRVI